MVTYCYRYIEMFEAELSPLNEMLTLTIVNIFKELNWTGEISKAFSIFQKLFAQKTIFTYLVSAVWQQKNNNTLEPLAYFGENKSNRN